MSQDEEIQYYSWAFQNNLETRESYLRKKNPDLAEEEIEKMLEDLGEGQEQEETQSILDKIGKQVG